jgi:hypothetical protein
MGLQNQFHSLRAPSSPKTPPMHTTVPTHDTHTVNASSSVSRRSFLSGKVDLVRGLVKASGLALLAVTGRCCPQSARALVPLRLSILPSRVLAVALSCRTGLARAPRARDGVFRGRLLACALQGGLLAAGALCLGCADAALVALAAAGGCLVISSHCDGGGGGGGERCVKIDGGKVKGG